MAGLAERVQDVDYIVRPPLQKRSREAWERILSAGVDLLRVGGYDAFTIAAVCDRAGVPPRAIYARVDTKEGLFLAVYEYGMASVREQMDTIFSDLSTTKEQPAVQLRAIVRGIAQVFESNADFLKPVLLLSSTHSEVHRRGSTYSRDLGGNFTAALRHFRSDIQHDSPGLALQMCFSLVHSAVVMRTMYGPGFAIPPVTSKRFADELAEVVVRYLFAPVIGQEADHPPNE